MCNQVLSNKSVASETYSKRFSLNQLIASWIGQLLMRKRKVLRTSELSPDLLRDIGLEDAAQNTGSLEEKWRQELDRMLR